MRLLIVNTYHYMRGGDVRHAMGLGRLLQGHGHEVHYFSMKSDKNIPCADEDHFVEEIDYRDAFRTKNPFNAFKVVSRCLYSVEAKRKIARLLDAVNPDIVHLHSIRHHLTKSILPEIMGRNIPIVWTLHDFKELCPNTSFYNGMAICEKCKNKKYLNVVSSKCKKGSIPASMITYLEAALDDWMNDPDCIDLYVAPSRFLRNKFIEYGYNPNRIVHLPNFLELDRFVPSYSHEDYLLFLGRLEREKGLATLIKGFAAATADTGSMILKIAGTGSMENELRDLIGRLGLTNVELLGFREGRDLEELIRNAKAAVIPSECYENYPFSALEAMAYGKPVIASRIGGLPEQVEDGVTGFLFEPFNDGQLAERMVSLHHLSSAEIAAMGCKARQKVERENSSQRYYGRIAGIYEELLERRGNQRRAEWN